MYLFEQVPVFPVAGCSQHEHDEDYPVRSMNEPAFDKAERKTRRVTVG